MPSKNISITKKKINSGSSIICDYEYGLVLKETSRLFLELIADNESEKVNSLLLANGMQGWLNTVAGNEVGQYLSTAMNRASPFQSRPASFETDRLSKALGCESGKFPGLRRGTNPLSVWDACTVKKLGVALCTRKRKPRERPF